MEVPLSHGSAGVREAGQRAVTQCIVGGLFALWCWEGERNRA